MGAYLRNRVKNRLANSKHICKKCLRKPLILEEIQVDSLADAQNQAHATEGKTLLLQKSLPLY